MFHLEDNNRDSGRNSNPKEPFWSRHDGWSDPILLVYAWPRQNALMQSINLTKTNAISQNRSCGLGKTAGCRLRLCCVMERKGEVEKGGWLYNQNRDSSAG